MSELCSVGTSDSASEVSCHYVNTYAHPCHEVNYFLTGRCQSLSSKNYPIPHLHTPFGPTPLGTILVDVGYHVYIV